MSLTTTAASLTVTAQSAPTAIKIATPVDGAYSTTQLVVQVTALPSDGTVYLADGVTPVLPGELLTVAELTGLTFAGDADAAGQSADFTYQVIDPAGITASGTASLSVIANSDGPQTTPVSLSVASAAAATAIGILAPTDPIYATTSLTVTVLGLPSNGSIVLTDGVTAVSAGEALSLTQLTGLQFIPTTGAFAESGVFRYRVSDPGGASSSGSATLSIAPSGNILTVGPGQQYSTIAAAVGASHNGDTIQVQAGTYVNDFAAINTDITLEGVGGMVNLVCTEQIPNGKAIFVTNGNITINNFSFSGAQVADNNGAGIRYETGNLVLNDDAFFSNQEGLLSASDTSGSIRINHSEFAYNGFGDGFTHNLYVGDIGSLTVDDSYFHDAIVGHEIKSRALSTTIENSRIDDGLAGTASYDIDLPNGGNAVIENNTIEKGPLAQNDVIITSGEEGNVYTSSSLTVSGNTILNDLTASGALAVRNDTTATAQITDNQFYGLTASQIASGPNTQSNNTLLTSEPALDTSHPWSPTVDTTVPTEPQSTLPVTIGGTATISYAFLSSQDPDQGPDQWLGPDQRIYTVETAPGHGTLLLNGQAASSFTQADIDNGLVQYVENGDAASADFFTFRLADPAGNSLGTEPFEIAILDQAGSQILSNTALSADVGGSALLFTNWLDTVALGNTPDEITYTMLQGPVHGAVIVNQAPVTSFTQAEIDDHQVVYASDGDAVTSDYFTFQVSDKTGDRSAAQTFTIDLSGGAGPPPAMTFADLAPPSTGSPKGTMSATTGSSPDPSLPRSGAGVLAVAATPSLDPNALAPTRPTA